jgi:16S rRNA processing protein RimM
MNKIATLEVARLGKLVGLKGELKLHIHSDFPEQFSVGKVFTTQKNLSLEVASYDVKKGLISFKDFQSRESAAKLVNSFLFTSIEQSEKDCTLEEGEFFWYEIIGMNVKEQSIFLGKIQEIQRIADVDYLVVQTDINLVDQKLSKSFYIPFIERYILDVDKALEEVHVKDALALLENS